MQARQRLALVLPLAGFLAAFFVAPLFWFLSFSVQETEIPRAFPKTLTALDGWTPGENVPDRAFASLAADLVEARRSGTLADAARRLNYEIHGIRTSLMRVAREINASSGREFTRDWFARTDPRLSDPSFFATIKQGQGPVSSFYLLSALDLTRDRDGRIHLAPPTHRVYIDVLFRTLVIALSVTLACLVLGFPLAHLLTQVSGRVAGVLMTLVLLPFWTSLLVRTVGWVVLLQREGLINSMLLRLRVISEPLTLIYNRTGVLIAMTHVLLPFLVLPLYSVLRDISPVYMRAASSLGASPIAAFFRVYLPLAAPGIFSGSLMVFILALGYYITPALVGGGADQMLSFYIASHTTDTGNWGLAAALGLLMLVVTLALYAVARRLSGGANVI